MSPAPCPGQPIKHRGRHGRDQGKGAGTWSSLSTPSVLGLAAITLFASSCWTTEASQSPFPSAIFLVEVGGDEQFRIEVTDPERIAEATGLIRNRTRASVHGDLVLGDGGYNVPYRWHLVPGSIQFGQDRLGQLVVLPSEVEENLGRWLREKQRYCPTAARIIAREM